MRVFITGATGWIGSAVTDELLAAGHEVVGLVRSDASHQALTGKGATALRGDLDDLAALRRGAEGADGVIHLANKHDWTRQPETNRTERTAVETIAETLLGSDRPLVLASGVTPTEADPSPWVGPDALRGGSENRAFDFLEQGVRAIAARFAPTTHGMGDHGFVRIIADAARSTGTSCYVGDGTNAWAAVHVSDAARLVRLGLEKAEAGARLHAVGENAVPTRAIAEAIAARYGLPTASISAEEAVARLGFVGGFFGQDVRSSSDLTRAAYDWQPTGPTLLDDIAAGAYDV